MATLVVVGSCFGCMVSPDVSSCFSVVVEPQAEFEFAFEPQPPGKEKSCQKKNKKIDIDL
jgi:hypothetical protein